MIKKIISIGLLSFSGIAFAALNCPTTQTDIVLGAGIGGATYVTNIALKKSYLNNMKDIVLCRYEGKKYQHAIGSSAQYLGLYRYDKYFTEGDYKKNNSTKGWNARIYGKDSKGNKKFACSAVVINPVWALTDKNCWENADNKWNDFWVKANVSNDSNDGNDISQEKDITTVKLRTIHEDGGGLALVKMSSPMVLSNYLPLYYSPKSSIEDSNATFYGWGCDGSDYCNNKDKPIHELNKRVGREDDSDQDDGFFDNIFFDDSNNRITYETSNDELFNDGDIGGSCVFDGYLMGIITWTRMRNSEMVICTLLHPQLTWIRDTSVW